MEKIGDETPKKGSGSHLSSFLNRIGGVFLASDATFSRIIADKIQFWEPFLLVLLLVGIHGAILASFAYRVLSAITTSISSITGGTPLGFLAIIPWIMLTLTIVIPLIFWVIVAGIAHVSAKYVFKGYGSFVQLMRLYGYSFIPYSVVILSTVLFGISWTLWPLSIFLNIVTTFWIVLLMAVAVKHNYGIDIGKAFVSSFIGPMVVWLIIVGILWAWMWLIISSFAGGLI